MSSSGPAGSLAAPGRREREGARLAVVDGARDRGVPAHVRSHASGGRDLWSDPLPEAPADRVEAVWSLLDEVLDPELPVSLVELGLVYGVEVSGEDVRVELTFTATACPCMEFIKEDVRDRLLLEDWIPRVRIEEVWDPPWTNDRITPAGREKLRGLGVAS